MEIVFLKIWQNSLENTCARVFYIKNETLVQEFSCEFCLTFKKTFFTEHLRTTVSIDTYLRNLLGRGSKLKTR